MCIHGLDSRYFAGFSFFVVWLHLPKFGNKFTEYFFISLECKFSNVHLASSSLRSNSKELSIASDTPFWTNPVFCYFATPQEDSPSVNFLFSGSGNTKSCNWLFGFWRGSCQKPYWMVCRQIEIIFVTKIDLNIMFFCNYIFDWQSFFAACKLQCAMIKTAIILMASLEPAQ